MEVRALTEITNEILRILARMNSVKTPVMTSVSTSGTIAAGYTSVTLITSADFAGTILGTTAVASRTYPFSSNGNPLSEIVYTRSAGTIQIIAM